MSEKAKEFEENYKELNDFAIELQRMNVNDVSEIVQNLPKYIDKFKSVDEKVGSMLTELDKMQELINEKVN